MRLLVTIYLAAVVSQKRAISVLNENRFNDLIVSLDEDLQIPEVNREEFIQNLKDLIISTSHALYEVTYSRIYFGNVTIIVPSFWNVTEAFETGKLLNVADIGVNEVGLGGNAPFTIPGGRCESPGLKMSLPSSFVDPKAQSVYTNPGKILAKEWLKLRYGVYDESGFPDDVWQPYSFYDAISNVTRINGCTNYQVLNGSWITENGTNCQAAEDDSSCRMEIYSSSADYSALFITYISEINKICNDSTHDVLSPTPHNRMCAGKSVLSVILKHPDFQGGKNKPGPVTADTTPTFVVLQKTPLPLMLLLDIDSGDNADKVQLIIDEVKATIPTILTSGIPAFGLAYFYGSNEEYSIKFFKQTTLINVEEIKQKKLIHFIKNTQLSNQSSAGVALSTTLQRLALDYDGAVNLLLIQTAKTDDDPPELFENETFIYTSGVLYGGSVYNPWLEDLSSSTGGEFFVNNAYDPSVSSKAMMSMTPEVDQIITLVSEKIKIGVENTTLNVVIDKSVGNQTVFDVRWQENAAVNLVLLRPDGEIEKSSSSSNKGFFDCFVDVADEGEWKLVMSSNADDTEVYIIVTSQAIYGTEQVKMELWTSSSEGVHNVTESPLAFYVSLRIGANPISGLNVFAQIYTSSTVNKQRITIPLLDNGIGDPDISSDDGIYSGYLINLEQLNAENDSISIVADVFIRGDGIQGKNILYKKSMSRGRSESTRLLTADPFFEEKMPEVVVMNIDRSIVSALSLFLTGVLNYDPPPSRILDLQTVNLDGEYYEVILVSLQWTAPGTDLTEGTAALYDLRYTDNVTLINRFEEWNAVTNDSQIEEGSLVPETAGSIENITIMLPKQYGHSIVYLIALRAVDQAGNQGDVSPSVMITAEAASAAITTTDVPPTSFIDPKDFVGSAGFIVLMVLIALIVVGALIGGVLLYLKTKKKTAEINDYPKPEKKKKEKKEKKVKKEKKTKKEKVVDTIETAVENATEESVERKGSKSSHDSGQHQSFYLSGSKRSSISSRS